MPLSERHGGGFYGCRACWRQVQRGTSDSVVLSNAELRSKLLKLQKAGWPSYALAANEPNTRVDVQVRIVPNSAEHKAPHRTFRFFTQEDKQQLNDFVEANLEKLESLRTFLESA